MNKILPIVLLLFCTNIIACSCNSISFKKAVIWADEIFFGRLIEIKEVQTEDTLDYHHNSQPYYEKKYTRVWYALFEVEKKWKGSSKKYVKVYQPSTSCDAEFRTLGRNYLVYAKNDEMFYWRNELSNTKLTTWLCSRSREFMGVSEPNDDLKKLDQKFSKKIDLYNNRINYLQYFSILIFLISGFLMGFYFRKRFNT